MGPRIAIVDGVRTPFCRAGGALKLAKADDLGAVAVRELIARTDLDVKEIDEVIIGNVCQPPHAANIARIISRKAGVPDSVTALTVQRNCASGIQAVTSGALQIMAGRADVIIAGGVESMSQVPLLYGPKMTSLFMKLASAKTIAQRLKAIASFRPSYLKPIIGLKLGLTDIFCGLNMGETAEILSREFSISRSEQDAFALESHRRACEAQKQGRFECEITPVIPPPTYNHPQLEDQGMRDNLTMDKLAKLRPYFDRCAGVVTVGNACPVTDGASALLVCSERAVKRLGVKPLGYLEGWSYAALDGARMGLGPAFATAKLLDQTNLKLTDFDCVELNEAFAAQALANFKAFASDSFAKQWLNRSEALGELDPQRVNINGGAIALGHPVGATGARIILTTLIELRRQQWRRGLATLCIGGGQGAAVALEAA